MTSKFIDFNYFEYKNYELKFTNIKNRQTFILKCSSGQKLETTLISNDEPFFGKVTHVSFIPCLDNIKLSYCK